MVPSYVICSPKVTPLGFSSTPGPVSCPQKLESHTGSRFSVACFFPIFSPATSICAETIHCASYTGLWMLEFITVSGHINC